MIIGYRDVKTWEVLQRAGRCRKVCLECVKGDVMKVVAE